MPWSREDEEIGSVEGGLILYDWSEQSCFV